MTATEVTRIYTLQVTDITMVRNDEVERWLQTKKNNSEEIKWRAKISLDAYNVVVTNNKVFCYERSNSGRRMTEITRTFTLHVTEKMIVDGDVDEKWLQRRKNNAPAIASRAKALWQVDDVVAKIDKVFATDVPVGYIFDED